MRPNRVLDASVSSDRGALRLGTPLISQGGSQGIGDQSYFPGGLLTTAQPVGYHKPSRMGTCDSRRFGKLHLVTGFRQKAETI